MKKSKSYDGSVHDKVVQGMANMLWWMAWADIAEENHISLSGKQIEMEAPPTPQKAFMLAERWLGHIENENISSAQMLRYYTKLLKECSALGLKELKLEFQLG